MNDDAPPSSSAREQRWDDDDAADPVSPNDSANVDQPAGPTSQESSQQQQPAAKKVKKSHCPGLKKKLVFLTHLLKSLDLVVFAELSALYYMESVKTYHLTACAC